MLKVVYKRLVAHLSNSCMKKADQQSLPSWCVSKLQYIYLRCVLGLTTMGGSMAKKAVAFSDDKFKCFVRYMIQVAKQ
jgi:hypothetical protein